MPFWGAYLALYYEYSASDIILFFSIFSVTVFLSEIPVGFVSDRLKSKKSVLIGMGLKTAALMLILLLEYPLVPFLSQFINGVGESFCSGSRDVLTFRYYKAWKKKGNYEEYNARLYAINWAGVLNAFLSASMLTPFGLKTVLLINALAFLLSTLSILFLNFSDSPSSNGFSTFKQLVYVKNEALSNKKLLKILIISALIQSILSSMFLLFQPLFNDLELNSTNNGYIYALVTIFAILGSAAQPKMQKGFTRDSFLFCVAVILMMLICFFLYEYSSFMVIIICFCLFRFTFGFTGPFIASAINSSIQNDEIRASLFSVQSMVLNLMQFLILYILQSIEISTQARYLILMLMLFVISIVFIGLQSRTIDH